MLEDLGFSLPRHPLGVRPVGNACTISTNLDSALIGLPDDIVIKVFEFLDSISLIKIGSTCRKLFAFSRFEEFWKIFCIENPERWSRWRGSWYTSYVGLDEQDLALPACENVFSDALYRPFLCANIPISPFSDNIPISNQIPKLKQLSSEDFHSSWATKPFILSGVVNRWEVSKRFRPEDLLEKYGNVIFRAEAVKWPYCLYFDYMQSTKDESPLYLFDSLFVEKMNLKVGSRQADIEEGWTGKEWPDYWPPECFGEDLFAILGRQRPDSRWLIVGPQRSGSTFHKDPNGTSAWNAVLHGAKYWVMFPPNQLPPGVFVSDDQSEVTSPLSIAEWLLGYHAEARRTPGCLEGICREGELVHVPSGWWHLVVNLTEHPSVAITQNFVPESRLPEAISFLKNKPEQVSGFPHDVEHPYEVFVEKMNERHPQLMNSIIHKAIQTSLTKKRKWEDIAKPGPHDKANGETADFSFAFMSNEDSDGDIS